VQTVSTDVRSASTSSPSGGVGANKSPAAPEAVMANLIWLGRIAGELTSWERGFLFDCTHLVESGEQMTNKQVATIKSLRVKYASM
jgi:hypothetical protein